jgi:UDP-2-acetamido-3-amino-2,3-dideoxy-glucuronate N-acetyltransferase
MENSIDQTAKLGKGTKVGKYSVIEGDVTIGKNCVIGNNVTIHAGTKIGDSVRIDDNAVIGKLPMKAAASATTIEQQLPPAQIGDHCLIGTSVVIENFCKIGSHCKLETNVYICAYSVLEDNCFIAPCVATSNDNYMARSRERFKHYKGVMVKKGGRIGLNATILPGKTIGEDSQVAAGAVVTKDTPPKKTVMGAPAKVWGDVPEDQLLENQ